MRDDSESCATTGVPGGLGGRLRQIRTARGMSVRELARRAVALAGALRAEDLPAVLVSGADIVGVRSAACLNGSRSGPLDAARVRALRAGLGFG